MRVITLRNFVCLIFAGLIGTLPLARADSVTLFGKPTFKNVEIRGFRENRLVFRGVSGELLRKPLDQIQRFRMDLYPALTSAELIAESHTESACAAYRQALDEVAEPWLQDLIRRRLLAAYDRSRQINVATLLYIQLVRSATPTDVIIPPRHPAQPGSPQNQQARESLEAVLSIGLPPGPTLSLRRLWLELLIYDDVSPLPAELVPETDAPRGGSAQPGEDSAQSTAGEAPAATSPAATSPAATSPAASSPVASQPADDRPPLLFGGADNRSLPAAPRYDQQQIPTLSADSLVLAGAREALEAGDAERAKRLIERALPYVEPSGKAAWMQLAQRCDAASPM